MSKQLRKRPRYQPLRLEPLEDRRLLAVVDGLSNLAAMPVDSSDLSTDFHSAGEVIDISLATDSSFVSFSVNDDGQPMNYLLISPSANDLNQFITTLDQQDAFDTTGEITDVADALYLPVTDHTVDSGTWQIGPQQTDLTGVQITSVPTLIVESLPGDLSAAAEIDGLWASHAAEDATFSLEEGLETDLSQSLLLAVPNVDAAMSIQASLSGDSQQGSSDPWTDTFTSSTLNPPLVTRTSISTPSDNVGPEIGIEPVRVSQSALSSQNPTADAEDQPAGDASATSLRPIDIGWNPSDNGKHADARADHEHGSLFAFTNTTSTNTTDVSIASHRPFRVARSHRKPSLLDRHHTSTNADLTTLTIERVSAGHEQDSRSWQSEPTAITGGAVSLNVGHNLMMSDRWLESTTAISESTSRLGEQAMNVARQWQDALWTQPDSLFPHTLVAISCIGSAVFWQSHLAGNITGESPSASRISRFHRR